MGIPSWSSFHGSVRRSTARGKGSITNEELTVEKEYVGISFPRSSVGMPTFRSEPFCAAGLVSNDPQCIPTRSVGTRELAFPGSPISRLAELRRPLLALEDRLEVRLIVQQLEIDIQELVDLGL